MKTLHFLIITILFTSMMHGIANSAFGDVTGGGPVEVAPYQFSDMVSVGNDTYVLYQQNANNGALYHIFFKKSSDSGQSFGNTIQLDNKTGNSPLVAVSGDNVYVTWADNFPGYPPSKALFAKSVDGGKTFGTPIVLDENLTASAFVTQLVADGSHVYAMITEEGEKPPYNSGVYLRTSQDNGTTFGDKIELLSTTTNPLALDVSMQKVGNKIYVSGEYEINCSANPNVCNYEIFLRQSNDYGATFGDIVNITKAVNPVDLRMHSSDNNVYVVWDQLVGEDVNLFLAKSNDGGHSFSIPEIISPKLGESSSPHMVASGKNLFVLWKYDNENVVNRMPLGSKPNLASEIFLLQSHDGGDTFGQPVNISGKVGTSYFSDLAESGGNVYVAWETIFGDKSQVFFRKSIDNGNSFGDPIKITDEKVSYQLEKMSADGNNVHIAIATSLPEDNLYLVSSQDEGTSFGNMVKLNEVTGNMESENLRLGPGSKVSPTQVYPENNNTNDMNNAIILAETGIPIVIGISIGVILFTRKKTV